MKRREFLSQGLLGVGAAWFLPRMECVAANDDAAPDWVAMVEDPVRKKFPGRPDLDLILKLYPRAQGEPAFDPERIAAAAAKLETTPAVNTGHPFLDRSVKTGLAHVDATFQGDHPKYGVGTYAEERCDGFPPIIIAAVDALSAWGMTRRAAQLFRYWLTTFVRNDGTIHYYGTSVSEYGQLLHTAALLEERAGVDGWWKEGFPALDRIAEHLLALHAEARKNEGLIRGAPEADTRDEIATYFHNNAWVAKGLQRWQALCRKRDAAPTTDAEVTGRVSETLAVNTVRAVVATWPRDAADWWLSPQVEPLKRPARLTGSHDIASYTNYRYWPELLSSGILPSRLANRMVESRLSAGGQFCGMTRFNRELDDWPLADYLHGVWSLGRKNDFLLSLFGHVAYHQAEHHLTAYEEVSFPPGKKITDYCLPCQLVAARAARLLQA